MNRFDDELSARRYAQERAEHEQRERWLQYEERMGQCKDLLGIREPTDPSSVFDEDDQAQLSEFMVVMARYRLPRAETVTHVEKPVPPKRSWIEQLIIGHPKVPVKGYRIGTLSAGAVDESTSEFVRGVKDSRVYYCQDGMLRCHFRDEYDRYYSGCRLPVESVTPQHKVAIIVSDEHGFTSTDFQYEETTLYRALSSIVNEEIRPYMKPRRQRVQEDTERSEQPDPPADPS